MYQIKDMTRAKNIYRKKIKNRHDLVIDMVNRWWDFPGKTLGAAFHTFLLIPFTLWIFSDVIGLEVFARVKNTQMPWGPHLCLPSQRPWLSYCESLRRIRLPKTQKQIDLIACIVWVQCNRCENLMRIIIENIENYKEITKNSKTFRELQHLFIYVFI